jgi:hypothetical protein
MKSIVALFLVVALGSCTKDWLDINKDPNVPTVPELSQLLSFSQLNMTNSLSQGNFIGNNLSGYVHQLVSRETQNYGMGTQANGIFNSWNYMYRYALVDFDAIIQNAEPEENMIYSGIAKTLKAYLFSMMVDLWGDVPFSEFNVAGLTAPKPDSSKDVYNDLIALLEEAKTNLEDTEAENSLKPGADDLFYAGNVAKWVRLNNTLKLKLLLQSRKAKSDIANWQSKFDALIADNKFIASGEDFQFWYNAATNPSDERHPAYIDEYAGGQVTYYVSPFFYEVMKGSTLNVTDNPFAGIIDPRIPYYFYNQLSGDASQNPHEYRNGDFMSIFFASAGPNSAHSNDASITKIGLYLCGGQYDDGAGVTVTGFKQGNGAAPHKMLTYATLKFMLAELVLAGETNGDAKALLSEGVSAAIAHVNSVAAKQTGVPTIEAAATTTFIEAVLAKYDAAADAEGKLKIVMTQKWIHNVFNPEDSYTDYRRTGYPAVFDPQKTQDPGYGVNPDATDQSAARVPLENIASFPRSLYYPTTSETNLNPNIKQKTNLSIPFVFWDK